MANYLYNGVELPALPEYDESAYPYAHLGTDNGSSLGYPDASVVSLLLYSVAGVVDADNANLTFTGPFSCISYLFTDSQDIVNLLVENGVSATVGSWVALEQYERAEGDVDGMSLDESLVWANYDILLNDGTIYLAASEPVPVGNNITIPDKASFMLGYLTGQRLRKMRVIEPVIEATQTEDELYISSARAVQIGEVLEVW